eukprot:TRINITY_DN14193_c0_g1_i1.p1 TRINITY_DN14193_c0_g1~~TRINITY_DN14193_c0_g1_i1.p1  ORF type:complete len:356 (+),score=76.51 TRINITY_DN14193_c0_g1_i1:35-1069(+)
MDTESLKKALPWVVLGAASAAIAFVIVRKSRKIATGTDGSDSDGEAVDIPKGVTMARRMSVSAECYDDDDDTAAAATAPKVGPAKTAQESAAILAVLSKSILFKHLSQEHLDEVVSAMFKQTFEENEVVMHQGDPGNFFYIVAEGEFAVTKDDNPKPLSVVGAGGFFGELALMYNMPRAATITAIGKHPRVTWVVERDTFRRVLMHAFTADRQRYNDFLERVEIFKTHMEQQARYKLADAFETKDFNDKETVVEQGAEGDAFYVIESGEATVIKDGKQVSALQKGGYFGELALLNGAPRAARVTANGKLRCAVLRVDAFKRLIPENVIEALRKASAAYGPVTQS